MLLLEKNKKLEKACMFATTLIWGEETKISEHTRERQNCPREWDLEMAYGAIYYTNIPQKNRLLFELARVYGITWKTFFKLPVFCHRRRHGCLPFARNVRNFQLKVKWITTWGEGGGRIRKFPVKKEYWKKPHFVSTFSVSSLLTKRLERKCKW